jgi:hypothetical protein
VREATPARLWLSERLLEIRALTVKWLRNLVIGRHFLHPAFYSAGNQDALLAVLQPPRLPRALAEVACVGNSNARHTACIRLSAAALLHTLNPITQLFRFIRPAT